MQEENRLLQKIENELTYKTKFIVPKCSLTLQFHGGTI